MPHSVRLKDKTGTGETSIMLKMQAQASMFHLPTIAVNGLPWRSL
jgi:hypothetical protein